ncbi:hypothetical protein ITP53_22950 [Nonomuraea sp. K274]|uniref:Uncharacterized protein n=1 Tax=Nonomuraea cypriaca TaxID=1187855 RepID=A0A931A907_9ACTN|nr:hypothetical protein [Nonomuraea cypriaca]MBF8188531.1 hypothetical protein [Nonomuraea cypriaca]
MRRRFLVLGAGMVAAVVTAAVVTSGASGSAIAGGAPAQPREVVVAHGDDRLPSTTAADWVTYADHVVVVTAVSEQRLPPAQIELERGEGLVGRTVDLKVKEVLWSRDGAPHPAPQSWVYNGAGFTFSDGDTSNFSPVALDERPRIEAGHQYILAIVWEDAHCSEGDKPEPGRWLGLGEGSELPYDGDVIGQGEYEGQIQTVEGARTLAEDAGLDVGLEEEMVGEGAAALAAKLKVATPGERQQPKAPATTSCE